jgi:hypothetical protein
MSSTQDFGHHLHVLSLNIYTPITLPTVGLDLTYFQLLLNHVLFPYMSSFLYMAGHWLWVFLPWRIDRELVAALSA